MSLAVICETCQVAHTEGPCWICGGPTRQGVVSISMAEHDEINCWAGGIPDRWTLYCAYEGQGTLGLCQAHEDQLCVR